MPAIDVRDVTIEASDGAPLGATVLEVDGTPRPWVVISAAVGTPHGFYRRFARFLAEHGYSVLAYDYRGIGASAPGSLRGFDADMTDWGRRDFGGAYRWASRRAGERGVVVIGHSFGGQILAMPDPAPEPLAVVVVASQSAYWGHWSWPLRPAVRALWRIVIPASTTLLGYFPSWMVGFGEPLPAGAARQWARWGRHPGYLFGHIDDATRARYDAFDPAMLVWSFTDDPIAIHPAVEKLLEGYPAATIDWRHRAPEDLGMPRVGHHGFFRESSRQALWQPTLAWLDGVTR
ncbi:MAG TPA: alpha/beta fold hydrolase [Longimicrobiales bacterium]|nr:alpha/beta fold hydrolase [Longimicrobiales bacterium]